MALDDYWVWAPSYGQRIKDGVQLGALDHEDAAESAAKIYHDERDFWESSWPIEFDVQRVKDKSTVRIEVEREMEPLFTACGKSVWHTPIPKDAQ